MEGALAPAFSKKPREGLSSALENMEGALCTCLRQETLKRSRGFAPACWRKRQGAQSRVSKVEQEGRARKVEEHLPHGGEAKAVRAEQAGQSAQGGGAAVESRRVERLAARLEAARCA